MLQWCKSSYGLCPAAAAAAAVGILVADGVYGCQMITSIGLIMADEKEEISLRVLQLSRLVSCSLGISPQLLLFSLLPILFLQWI